MGRLSRDCFDAGPAPMRVAEAVALLRARLPILSGIESVSVERADGRVLAEDLIAPIDLPPFDNAAVDGYAVRAGDLAPAGETRLPLGGRVPAGHAPADPGPGFAVRIFTGAPMPPGTDTVAMQEDVRLDGDAVILPAGLAPAPIAAGPGRMWPAAAARSRPGRSWGRATSRSPPRSACPRCACGCRSRWRCSPRATS
ncbi:Molybdopterin molybdenumtransferase [Methylobacterium brachiatum]|nr:Molybdopterin molybdenumtransferase [Methylobacterium brachiatum]